MKASHAAALAAVIALAGCGDGNEPAQQPAAPHVKGERLVGDPRRHSESPRSHGKKPPPLHAKALRKRLSTPPSPVTFVRTALTAQQPGLACLVYTREALVRAYGGVDGCQAAVRSGGSADSVEIRSAQRDGSSALVVAVPDGGPSSGETLKISLVLDRRAWRIAAIHSNVPVGP